MLKFICIPLLVPAAVTAAIVLPYSGLTDSSQDMAFTEENLITESPAREMPLDRSPWLTRELASGHRGFDFAGGAGELVAIDATIAAIATAEQMRIEQELEPLMEMLAGGSTDADLAKVLRFELPAEINQSTVSSVPESGLFGVLGLALVIGMPFVSWLRGDLQSREND